MRGGVWGRKALRADVICCTLDEMEVRFEADTLTRAKLRQCCLIDLREGQF